MKLADLIEIPKFGNVLVYVLEIYCILKLNFDTPYVKSNVAELQMLFKVSIFCTVCISNPPKPL